jgi:hypothetical protein
VVLYGQDERNGRISSLFTKYAQFPKLDVAGSIPVSRSLESVAYADILPLGGALNGVAVGYAFLSRSNQSRQAVEKSAGIAGIRRLRP